MNPERDRMFARHMDARNRLAEAQRTPEERLREFLDTHPDDPRIDPDRFPDEFRLAFARYLISLPLADFVEAIRHIPVASQHPYMIVRGFKKTH